MRELKLMVPAEFDGAEAQTFLKSRGFSRRALIRLKQTGGLTRGGALLRTVDEVHCGEELCVRLSDDAESAEPESGAERPGDLRGRGRRGVRQAAAHAGAPLNTPPREHPREPVRGAVSGTSVQTDKPAGPQHERALRVRKESIRCLGALRVAFQGVFRSYLRHSARGIPWTLR